MSSRFEICTAFTRAEEGGYVDDFRDSGNWTSGHVGQGSLIGSNMGVGAPTLVAWMGVGASATAEQMRKLTLSTYEAIARCKYWIPLGCPMLPAGLDLMMFDFAWNRGPMTSRGILLQCLNIDPAAKILSSTDLSEKIEQASLTRLLMHMSNSTIQTLQHFLEVREDGIAGPETRKALEARGDLRMSAIILALSDLQVLSYQRLTNFALYGAGWLARSSRRQAAALSVAK